MSPESFVLFSAPLPEPMVLVGGDGSIVAANPAAGRLTGADAGGLPGQRLHDIVSDDAAKVDQWLATWSRSSQMLPCILSVAACEGDPVRYHCTGAVVRPKSGVEPAVILLVFKQRQAMLQGFAALNEKIDQLQREINERRLAESALRQSEERVRLLLDSTGEAIYGIDLEGRCTFANPACARVIGYDDPAELIGKDMHGLTHHSRGDGTAYPVDECPINKGLRDGTGAHCDDEVFWRRDGTGFAVEYWSYPIIREDRMVGSVVAFFDITERKRAEEEIRRLNEDLEARVEQRTAELGAANTRLTESLRELRLAQEQLVQSEKMAALGNLVAGVAHEINTPVGVGVTAASHLEAKVLRYRELYRQGKLTRTDFEKFLDVAGESSEIVSANLKRAAGLISSFKQVAVDQSSGDRRRFKVREYIEELLKSLNPKLKRTRHQVRVECPGELAIDSYPGAFSQIITNLILNSLAHGFEDDTPGEILLGVRAEGGHLELHYSDNGKGIPEEHLKRIYDPFFTTRRGQGGSGLGMHIVFNLVTQTLGGRIECRSSPGQGVVFEIRVPLQDPVPQAADEPSLQAGVAR